MTGFSPTGVTPHTKELLARLQAEANAGKLNPADVQAYIDAEVAAADALGFGQNTNIELSWVKDVPALVATAKSHGQKITWYDPPSKANSYQGSVTTPDGTRHVYQTKAGYQAGNVKNPPSIWDQLTSPLQSLTHFLDLITSGTFWLRVAEVLGGLVLVGVGLAKVTNIGPTLQKIPVYGKAIP